MTFNAASGVLAASATFEYVAGELVVTLSNTSPHDVLVPEQVLTALFFDYDGPALALTPVSAVLAPGSTVLFGGSDPGGVVGGEWEYQDTFALPTPYGAAYGISSAGFGLFGSGAMFPGNNLQGPAGIDGLQYGLTSAGDDPATGNTPVTGLYALIRHEVVFRLSGAPADFDESRIHNVRWQYGTALSDPNVPEPASLVLVALGTLGALRRR